MSSSPEFDQLRSEIEALRREVQALSKYALELRAELRRGTERLDGSVKDLDARMIQLDTRSTQLDATAILLDAEIREILDSRTWRTLTKAASVLLRLGGSTPRGGIGPVRITGSSSCSRDSSRAGCDRAARLIRTLAGRVRIRRGIRAGGTAVRAALEAPFRRDYARALHCAVLPRV